ncbi:MAG: hypothetical protein SVV03_03385 [Candidatus Nanohaloarchaea archaeon]|nr:hypothetical protein [Candidatus Nanohaloarchaea archaeon]
MVVVNSSCPVSGKEIDPENPPASTQHRGETIGFCCTNCKEAFNSTWE